MKPLFMLALMVALAPVVASGQTPETHIIDPYPAGKPEGSNVKVSYVKAIGFFTSKTMPSVVSGTDRGLYLYTSSSGELSGPWVKSTIDPVGEYYEQVAALLKPGDTYPGVVVSRSIKSGGPPYQLVWYSNPKNRGGDPSQPWPMEIINPYAGCHELRVGDVDGDGLLDVVCSATTAGGTLNFIVFQDSSNHWKIVDDPFRHQGFVARVGESIDLIAISGGPRINVVAANDSGVYWFKNPKLTGGNPRTDPWPGFRVGDGNRGVSIGTGVFNRSGESIVVASSEELPAPWAPGLVWYEPPPDPTQPWVSHSVDSTYRWVHQINTGSSNGRPYFIVGEQEQTCGTPLVAATHPGIPCRVTMFQFKEGSFIPLPIYEHGTHNQSAINYKGGILIVGANHGIYGSPYRALHAWFIDESSFAASSHQ
jgi:hypothetical protein